LAEQVGLTVSGVTKALAPLEKQGYIETLDEVSDARVRKVAMTRSGGELFKDMERDMERKMANAHHHLSKLLREIA
jgi:DNA-binding MarR family transcriptional regulator